MVALGRRLQPLVSLGTGEVSWLKDNSVHEEEMDIERLSD